MTLPYQKHSPTSFQAALDFEDRALPARHRVFLAVKSLGGATDEEVQDATDMNPNTQRPRRIELVIAGLVEDSGQTRKTRSGTQAVVWVAKEDAEYQESLFQKVPDPSNLRGLAKALAEIEGALPKKRSREVQELLHRLHREVQEDQDKKDDDFLSFLSTYA